jgi:hypothetical protein
MSGTTETWYAVIDGFGNLVSIGTVLADPVVLTARGYQAIQLGGNPNGMVWNPATRSFAAAPAPAIVLVPWQFIQLFSPSVYGAMHNSTDPVIGQFMMMVQSANTINLSDPVVVNGIGYLQQQNVLTATQAANVLAGKPTG